MRLGVDSKIIGSLYVVGVVFPLLGAHQKAI